MTLPYWLKEPLVHFLAIGALIYAALAWSGAEDDPTSRLVRVDQTQLASLAERFERLMGRPPTDREMDEAIERFVREEVLYREALKLGLDEGDPVMRQRMVAKMDMSASIAAELAQPAEATLRAYFAENAERYASEVAVSFDQVFFSSEPDARAAIGAVGPEGEAIDLPREVHDMALGEVASRFGRQFARSLGDLEAGETWRGPIPSGFGWHLVRLRSKEASPSAFEGVRDRVANDWRSEAIEARKNAAYEVLRDAYRIEIER